MRLLINHVWCNESNWDDTMYSCRHALTIERVGKGKSYYDEPETDWTNLVEEDVKFFSQKAFDEWKDKYPEDQARRYASKETNRLNEEVINWLNANVEDRPLGRGQEGESTKGWCMGSDAYRERESIQITLWFHREEDVKKFVKQWSSYKEFTLYFNYFKDIRKELNPATNKLETVEAFT